MNRAIAVHLFALAMGFAAVVGPAGCSNQGEGQPCDTNNGSDDCDTGLVCTSKAQLNRNTDLCCPLGPATVASCNKGGAMTTPDGSTPDAGSEAAAPVSEASAEAASEDAA